MKELDLEFNQKKVLDEAFKVRDKYIYLSRTIIAMLRLWDADAAKEFNVDPDLDETELLGNIFGVGQIDNKSSFLDTNHTFDEKKKKALAKLRLLGYENCYLIDDALTFAVGNLCSLDDYYTELKVPEKLVDFHFMQDSPLDCIKLNSMNFYGRYLEGHSYEAVGGKAVEKFSREITAHNFLCVRNSKKLRLHAIGAKYLRVDSNSNIFIDVRDSKCYVEACNNKEISIKLVGLTDSIISISNSKHAVVGVENCRNCIISVDNCVDSAIDSLGGNKCLLQAHSNKSNSNLVITDSNGKSNMYLDRYDISYYID